MHLRNYGNIILLLFVVVEHLVWSVAGYHEKISTLYVVVAEVLNLFVLITFCYNMMAKRHTDLGLFIIAVYSIGSSMLLAAQMQLPELRLHVLESDAVFGLMDFFVFAIVHLLYLLVVGAYFIKKRIYNE